MSSAIQKLTKLKLIRPPQFLPENVHYETIMGSVAYGVSSDTSDMDIYGFCIPPKDDIFPHLRGEIPGFGRQKQRFAQFQQHGIDLVAEEKKYDFTIYSIVKYFQLLMENNPNMIDSIHTPQNCVLHCTQIGTMVRENRKLFLHKGAWHKFKGYAFAQLHKSDTKNQKVRDLVKFEQWFQISQKTKLDDVLEEIYRRELQPAENIQPIENNIKDQLVFEPVRLSIWNLWGLMHKPLKHTIGLGGLSDDMLLWYYHFYSERVKESRRTQAIKEHGMDTKFLYHVVRLLSEIEQILVTEGELDLQETGRREHMKSIRRGEVSEEEIRKWAASKEHDLEKLYHKSALQYAPDEGKIKQLLMNCLETHYGNLGSAVALPEEPMTALREIQDVLSKHHRLFS